MQDTRDDSPYGLYLVRGETEHRHGSVDGFVIASIRDGSCLIVASVAFNKVVSRRISDQT